jgi:hypothetical protein
MKISLPGIITVASLSVMAGCSAAPTSPSGPAATAVPAKTATPKPPVPTAAPLTADAEATMKAARSLGYVPRNHHGTIVYCRTESQLGTRFVSTTCISQEQVASAVERSVGNRDSVEDMQKKSLLQGQGY